MRVTEIFVFALLGMKLVKAMIIHLQPNPINYVSLSKNKRKLDEDDYTFTKVNNKMAANEKVEKIEKIKHDILDKLKLDRAPIETFSRRNISEPLLESLFNEEENLNITKKSNLTNDITIIGESVHSSNNHRRSCVSFTEQLQSIKINLVQLWINIKHAKTSKHPYIKIYALKQGETHKRQIAQARYQNSFSSWQSINIQPKHILKENETARNYINVTLEIQCKHCKIAFNEMPFLLLSTTSQALVRNRRLTSSDDCRRCSCCRSPLVINFKEIGWDNWIISPPSYNAYYCNGNCHDNNNNKKRSHKGGNPSFQSTFFKQSIKGRAAYCKPSKFSSITIFYINDGILIKRRIDDMIVDECDCM